MYFKTNLPSLPCEPVDANGAHHPADRNQTFVDDGQVASVLGDWSQQEWVEQSFFGEDFAGRQEYDHARGDMAEVHEIFRGRVELGPFYSRPVPPDSEVAQPPCRPMLKAWLTESVPISAPWRHRTITAVSSAAMLLSTVLFGLLNPKKNAAESPTKTDESLTPRIAVGQTSANFENWQTEYAVSEENFLELTSTKRR